jgi:hypothetical protein
MRSSDGIGGRPALHFNRQKIRQVLATEKQALRHGTPVHLHLGISDVTARIAVRRGAALAPGTCALVQVFAASSPLSSRCQRKQQWGRCSRAPRKGFISCVSHVH